MEPNNKEILRNLADNEALMKTVKELLLKQFSVDTLDATLADIQLGEMVKARLVGIKAVEDAFRIIEQSKSQQISTDKTNPAI